MPAAPLGQPVGIAAFRDDKGRGDRIVITLKVDTPPPAGQALVAFLIKDDGATQPLGALKSDGSGAGLEFSATDGASLAGRFSRIVISQEPEGSSPAQPGGQVRFSGALPAQALPQLAQLLAEGPGLPTRQGYIAGLRDQSQELLRHAQFVANAQTAGDLAGLKRHAEHVYNLVAGSLDPQFGDLNGDGRPQNPGDGFGLLPNAGQPGYIKAAAGAAIAAAQVPDASVAIKVHAEHVCACTDNMSGWAGEARDLALQLTRAGDPAAAGNQVARLLTLAQWIERGNDINGDGEIAPIPGEGGSLVAYEHAQFMGGFGLFPGP